MKVCKMKLKSLKKIFNIKTSKKLILKIFKTVNFQLLTFKKSFRKKMEKNKYKNGANYQKYYELSEEKHRLKMFIIKN